MTGPEPSLCARSWADARGWPARAGTALGRLERASRRPRLYLLLSTSSLPPSCIVCVREKRVPACRWRRQSWRPALCSAATLTSTFRRAATLRAEPRCAPRSRPPSAATPRRPLGRTLPALSAATRSLRCLRCAARRHDPSCIHSGAPNKPARPRRSTAVRSRKAAPAPRLSSSRSRRLPAGAPSARRERDHLSTTSTISAS